MNIFKNDVKFVGKINRYKPKNKIYYRLGRNSLLIDDKANEKDINVSDNANPLLITSQDGKKLIKCKDESETIIVPDTITTIGASAFEDCLNLREIIIPDTVTTIDKNAFCLCTSLEKIIIPKGVTTIGAKAFTGCHNLKEIIIPDTVTTIADSTFYACQNLTEITIPEGITTIEPCAFAGCHSLEKIIIPKGVTTIGASAFSLCHNLKEITIPEGVTTIGACAFADCDSLPKITLPTTTTTIEEAAFRGCHNLKKITIPEGVTTIGKSAFLKCYFLQEVNIPDTVTRIAEYVFEGCFCLKEITIPEGVTTIGASAFAGCDSLEKIIIPKGVTTIGGSAFENCEDLREITIPDTVTTIGKNVFTNCYHLIINYNGLKFKMPKDTELLNDIDNFYRNMIIALQNAEEYIITLLDKNNNMDESNNEITYIYNQIIKLTHKDNNIILEKHLKEFDIETFKDNIEKLKEYGFSNEKIIYSIAQGKNYELLNIPIEYAMMNYHYIIDQNKISTENLDKIIFGDISGQNFMDKMVNYYQLFGKFPDSLKTLMTSPENQLELRDRLEYISISCAQNRNLNYSNARLMFNRTLFENIAEYDKEKFEKIDKENCLKILSKYPQMKGILEPFYEKLSGIDQNWYNELIIEITKDNNKIFNDYFNCLNTIKNWDNIPDERERATRLKNELIGKLLYVKIAYLCTKHNLENAKTPKLRKMFNSTYIPIEELLQLATMSENGKTVIKKQVGFDNVENMPVYEYQEKNPNLAIINKLLEIDPYAFDIFKNDQQSKKIEIVIAALAKNNGYLFEQKEIKNYLEQIKQMNFEEILKEFDDCKTSPIIKDDIIEMFEMSNTKTQFKEYLSNQVGIPKIPTENKKEYLEKVRILAKNYANNNTTDELINFTSALDLYLRANSEYLFQSREDDQEIVSKIVFDRNSPIDDNSKILYSLYNLNKLAHNSSEIHLLSYLENKYRLSKDKQAETTNKLQSAINSYVSLSKYGLTNEQINVLLSGAYDYTDNSKVFSQGEIFSLNQFLSQEKKKLPVLDNEEIVLIEKVLEEEKKNEIEHTTLFPDDLEKLKQAQIQKEMKKHFSKIATLSDEEKMQLNNFIEESKTFYECKKIFAEEIMNKLSKKITNEFENIMFTDIETKQQFYAENGFIAEIQYDESNNLVLACLSEQFNESFSIHLKDLDEKTKQRFINNIKSPTISHVKLLGKGLTLRNETYDDYMDMYSSDENFTGFIDSYEMLGQAMKSNYDMYDVPARKLRQEKVQQNKEKQEEIEILLLEEYIKKTNTEESYSSKNRAK